MSSPNSSGIQSGLSFTSLDFKVLCIAKTLVDFHEAYGCAQFIVRDALSGTSDGYKIRTAEVGDDFVVTVSNENLAISFSRSY